MGKVETSAENGPRRKDKYLNWRSPKRETDDSNLSPGTRRGTTSTQPNPNDGEGETYKIQSGSSQMEKKM